MNKNSFLRDFPDDEPTKPTEGTFAEELLRSAAYSAVEGPVLGVTQAIDQARGSDLSARVQDKFASLKIERPATDVTFGSGTWLAQNIGSGLGMSVPVAISAVLTRGAFGRGLAMSELSRGSMLALSTKEAAATGLFYGTVFTPTDGTVTGNFVADRLINGGTTAVSFGLLPGASNLLSKVTSIRNPILAGIASGIPGGAINAETEAWKDRRFFASADELGHGMISMSVVGGMFGAKNYWRMRQSAGAPGTDAPLPEQTPITSARIASSSEPVSLRADTLNLSVSEPLALADRPQQRSIRAGTSASSDVSVPTDATDHGVGLLRQQTETVTTLTPPQLAPSVPHVQLAMIENAEMKALTLLQAPELHEVLRTDLPQTKDLPRPLQSAVEAKPQIPAATTDWYREGDLSTARWRLGLLVKDAADNTTMVWDRFNETARVFDKDGQVLSATVKRGSEISHQQYVRDEKNNLRAVLLGADQGWFNTPSGWAEGRVDASSGKLSLLPAEFKHGAIDPDAGFFLGNDKEGFSLPLNGRHRLYNEKNVWVNFADPQYEQRLSWKLAARLNDSATFDKLGDDLATFGKHTENKVGGRTAFLAELNRELTAGNLNAIDLLQTANTLLQHPNIRQMSVKRNSNNLYEMSTGGYNDEVHFTYYPDGSRVRLTEHDRISTTKVPDAMITEDLKDKSVRKYNSTKGWETIDETKTGKLERKVEYDPNYKSETKPRFFVAVEQTKNGLSDKLVLDGKDWKLIQKYGTTSHTRALGSGELDSMSKPQFLEDSGVKIEFDDKGNVRRTNTDNSTDLLLPGYAQVVDGAPLNETKSKIVSYVRHGDADYWQRRDLLNATSNFLKSAKSAGIPESKQAILLSEINRQIEINPERAARLTDALSTRLWTDDHVSVRRGDTQVNIQIGNDEFSLGNDGSEIQTRKVLLETNPRVPEELSKKIAQSLEKLEPNTLNLLQDFGVRVVPAERLASILDDKQVSAQPDHWPDGTSNEYLDGHYDEATKQIIIPNEHKYTRNAQHLWTRNETPGHGVMNALGQAADEAMGSFSESKEFVRAFEQDRLSAQKDIAKEYGSGQLPQKRLFADLFASMHNEPLSVEQKALLDKNFARTRDLIEERLQRVPEQIDAARTNDTAADKPVAEQVEVPNIMDHPQVKDLLNLQTGFRDTPSDRAKPIVSGTKIPESTGPATTLIDGTQMESWKHGTIVSYPDGVTDVINSIRNTTASFDGSGKLIEATANINGEIHRHSFTYDTNGLLKSVALSDSRAWLRGPQGWVKVGSVFDGELTFIQPDARLFPHPSGGVVEDRDNYTNQIFPDGRKLLMRGDGLAPDLSGANASHEYEVANRLVELAFTDAETRQHVKESLDTFVKQMDNIEGIGDEKGDFLGEVNRLLEEDPAAVTPLLDTVNSRMESGNYSGFTLRDRKVDGKPVIVFKGTNGAADSVYHVDGTREIKNKTSIERWNTDGTYERTEKYQTGLPTLYYGANGRLDKLTAFANLQSKFDRSFEYSSDGMLRTVSDSRKNGTKISWTNDGTEWTRVQTNSAGKENIEKLGPGTAELGADGSITLRLVKEQEQRTLSSQGEEKIETSDDRVQIRKGNDRTDFTSANFERENALFQQNFSKIAKDNNLLEERVGRLNKSLEEYLKNATERGIDTNTQALTLVQFNRLLAPSEHPLLPSKERLDLSEQLLRQLSDAVRTKQGDATCNVTTVEHRMAVLNPDKLAQVLADTVVNGRYVYDDARATELAQLSRVLEPDEEARTNMSVQDKGGEDIVVSGKRTWASQIIQSVFVHSAWLDKALYVRGNRILDDHSFGFIPDWKSSGERKLVVFDPSVVTPLNPGHLDRPRVFSTDGQVFGMLPPGKFTEVRDAKNRWLSDIPQGSKGFNERGKPLFAKTSVGDISYGRKIGEFENLLLRTDKAHEPLRNTDGELEDTPSLRSDRLQSVYSLVAGAENAGTKFVIERGSGWSDKVELVSTPEELATKLTNLKDAHQLPGVLRVETRHRPFGHWTGGGGHVVNVYDYNPETQTARYSNQWNDVDNYMGEKGIPIKTLFDAMETPLTVPASAALVRPIPQLDRKLFNWLKLDD